ncbi:NUDIX domain-containing protein [Candidatus Bipolaricaulota bacterium]|nr:NUDIX domain-containing protein [Candidatus Bipolaricaulota bacterium]
MNRPRISARAFIESEELVLLSSYRDRSGDWFVFPGGGQRAGETLHECLIREVEEETSLQVEIGRLRWVREFIAADFPDSEIDPEFHQVELTFECLMKDGQVAKLGSNPDLGQTGLRWASIEQLLSLRFFPHAVACILNGDLPDRKYLGAV